MSKIFQNAFNWVAKKFSKDASKMLIVTSAAGWALSSFAQIGAIVVNPKIKDDQKLYLIPQELGDAAANIGAFLLITQFVKKTTERLFVTGKFASKDVRTYLNNHPDLKDKVGKIDFNLDDVVSKDKLFPKENYYKVKNFGTALATVCAGIVATNIITPLIRNKIASRAQKTYIDVVQKSDTQKPNNEYKTQPVNIVNSGSMKI